MEHTGLSKGLHALQAPSKWAVTGARAKRFIKQQASRGCHSHRKDVISASHLIWDSSMRVPDRADGRHKRVATASVAAIPGEAIPLLGIGTPVTGTACESMKDLDDLYAGLGMTVNPDNVDGSNFRGTITARRTTSYRFVDL